MNETEIRNQIQHKLSVIEKQEHVRILHAVESGSRAWGFASPDSDYDVRFLYVRQQHDYLKLNPLRDVIEFQLDDVFDINGWDLQKALRLLKNANPTLFEWTDSPIVYRTTSFFQQLRPVIYSYFSRKAGLYHYLRTARHNYYAYCKKEQVKYKKYFYVIRPLLAGHWILEQGTPPPVLFSGLLELKEAQKIRSLTEYLLEIKSRTSELGRGEQIPELDCWITQNLAYLHQQADKFPDDKNPDWNALNSAFLQSFL